MKLPLTREAHQDRLPRDYTNEQLYDLLAKTLEATRGKVNIQFHPESGRYRDVDRARPTRINGPHYRGYVESPLRPDAKHLPVYRSHLYATNERDMLLLILGNVYRYHYDIASNTPMNHDLHGK